MGRKQKSKPPVESEQKFSGLGRSVNEDVFIKVLDTFGKLYKEDFGKVLNEFRIFIMNDYLKDNLNVYIQYTFEDMKKLTELANQKAVSFMKKNYFKYTEGYNEREDS